MKDLEETSSTLAGGGGDDRDPPDDSFGDLPEMPPDEPEREPLNLWKLDRWAAWLYDRKDRRQFHKDTLWLPALVVIGGIGGFAAFLVTNRGNAEIWWAALGPLVGWLLKGLYDRNNER